MTDVQVVEGYLVFMPIHAAIPVPFWDRVKARAQEAGRSQELRAEYLEQRGRIGQHRTEDLWWGAPEEMEQERAFFRRWVARLFGEPALWPWQRGWTEALVDSYLTAPAAREAA